MDPVHKFFLSSLLAGAVAGTAVDVILYPLDTIKTRLQTGTFHKSGGFRSIYSGLASVVVGSAPNAALFFCTYEGTKKIFEPHVTELTKPCVHMVAASLGEVTACLLRVPVEVVKQRTQANISSSSWRTFQAVVSEEGFAGLFRGYFSTVVREIPFSFIQFPIWEILKSSWTSHQGYNVEPWQASVCGAVAGGLAAGLTTPLDVAKTRIMLAAKDSQLSKGSILTALSYVLREKGVAGLFSGVVPRMTSLSIGGAIFLGVYHKAKSVLNNLGI